jgi:UrcA family protein
MVSPSTLVKTLGRTTAIVLAASTLGFATQASAFGGTLVDRVVTVKLKKSELAAPEGIEKSYTKLKVRAERFCNSIDSTLFLTGESVDECTSELLTQFVQSTGLEVLQNYHSSQ